MSKWISISTHFAKLIITGDISDHSGSDCKIVSMLWHYLNVFTASWKHSLLEMKLIIVNFCLMVVYFCREELWGSVQMGRKRQLPQNTLVFVSYFTHSFLNRAFLEARTTYNLIQRPGEFIEIPRITGGAFSSGALYLTERVILVCFRSNTWVWITDLLG